MIELAPNSKRGLVLRGPLMLAAGGYGAELDPELLERVDALVTLPTSLRPRAPARGNPRIVTLPGGFLSNRAGANPGLAVVLRERRHVWRKLAIPVILTLSGADMRHWLEIAVRASRSGVVSGFQCELVESIDVEATLAALRSETDLPLIAKIPIDRAFQAESAIAGGADALTVGLGPRGAFMMNGTHWEGRLEGMALKSLALHAIFALAKQFPELPLIAAGGIQSAQDVREFLEVGARAVQVDVAVWRYPAVLAEIATAMRGSNA